MQQDRHKVDTTAFPTLAVVLFGSDKDDTLALVRVRQ